MKNIDKNVDNNSSDLFRKKSLETDNWKKILRRHYGYYVKINSSHFKNLDLYACVMYFEKSLIRDFESMHQNNM